MIKYLHCSFAGSYWVPCKLLTKYKDNTYKIKYTCPLTGETVKEVVSAEYIDNPNVSTTSSTNL